MLEAIQIPCRCGHHTLTFVRTRPPQAAIDVRGLIHPPSVAFREAFERGLQDLHVQQLHARFRGGGLGGTP